MTKKSCENCEALRKSLRHTEEANEYLHSIREIFCFENITQYLLGQGFNVASVTVSKENTGKKSYEATAVKLKSKEEKEPIMKSANTLEELESQVMGNSPLKEEDEDLL